MDAEDFWLVAIIGLVITGVIAFIFITNNQAEKSDKHHDQSIACTSVGGTWLENKCYDHPKILDFPKPK